MNSRLWRYGMFHSVRDISDNMLLGHPRCHRIQRCGLTALYSGHLIYISISRSSDTTVRVKHLCFYRWPKNSLDLPGIVEGASQGRGRGRQVVSTAKTSDLIIIMLDATKSVEQRRLLEVELDAVGIRLNKQKPDGEERNLVHCLNLIFYL